MRWYGLLIVNGIAICSGNYQLCRFTLSFPLVLPQMRKWRSFYTTSPRTTQCLETVQRVCLLFGYLGKIRLERWALYSG